MILQALLLVTNQAEQFIRLFSVVLLSTLQSPLSVVWTRGSGVLRKGQHSWNRMDPKVVVESSMEYPYRGIFFCP